MSAFHRFLLSWQRRVQSSSAYIPRFSVIPSVSSLRIQRDVTSIRAIFDALYDVCLLNLVGRISPRLSITRYGRFNTRILSAPPNLILWISRLKQCENEKEDWVDGFYIKRKIIAYLKKRVILFVRKLFDIFF